MDDSAHQSQHATGALEPLERRPVLVQPVEQLRVDRVGRLDPVLVGDLGALAGELAAVLGVELDELAGDRGDVPAGGGVRLDEQPATDDLERLVRRRRAPLVSDPPYDVLQPPQGFLAVRPADL